MATIEELAKVEQPKIPKSGSIGFQEALGIQQPYLTRKAEIQTGISEASKEEALAKQRQQEGLAEEKARVQETYAGAERAAREGFQERIAQEPLPEFVPTKDTVQDIAGLFGLIGVIGMIAGKGNAMQAMNAMNGMLEGHRKGRLELYRQERDTFEKNFRAMLKKHEEFRREMDDAIKTAATDKQAGFMKAEAAAVKAGSDIVRAQLRKGDLMGAYKLVEESGKGAQNALATEAKMREAAANRAAAMQRTQMQIAAADARAERKTGAGGAEKPPPKEIVAQNQLRNNLIPKIEKALPVLDRLNKEGKWATMTTLLAIDPRAAEAEFKNDKEALDLILTLAYFRSKEFETAGKALTRKEDQILAPIVRGDLRAYEGLKNAMEVGLKTLKAEQKGLEATYPFIKTFNEAMRGDTEATEPPAPGAKPMPTGDKLKAYADQHFGGDENAAQNYLRTQGYE